MTRNVVLILLIFFPLSFLSAQSLSPYFFDTGSPTLQNLYIDPLSGSDDNDGLSVGNAFRTLAHAWQQIPQGTLSSSGYQINILPGTLTTADMPNYWENRHGTANFPIIFQSYSETATLTGDINMFNCSYVYFINLNITPEPARDVFHCEQCSYILLRGLTLNGRGAAHETIKVNQSDHIYIENSNISGSYENAIDYVAVQYGHVVGSRIHNADDWCMYAKGGSAYLRFSGNIIFNCGTGGFTAGQGTGFEYMTSPWLHYEAYDLKFINNIVHDTEGAAIGVNGGYNILLAHNTFYNVGERSHVIEAVHGSRSCDGEAVRCANNQAAGGWGPANVGGDEPIPNKNIFIYNNALLNIAPYQSQWQHFAVNGNSSASLASNIPNPVRTDENLRISGNVIWNGDSGMAIGIGEGTGCQNDNSTCNLAQLTSNNNLNTDLPDFKNIDNEDFRPQASGVLAGILADAIPDFAGGDRPSTPLAPLGNLSNLVTYDYAGVSRSGSSNIGAYHSSSSALNRTLPDGFPATPADPDDVSSDTEAPQISNLRLRVRESEGRVVVNVRSVQITDNIEVSSVILRLRSGTRNRTLNLVEGESGIYSGRLRIRGALPARVRITAIDSSNNISRLRRILQ